MYRTECSASMCACAVHSMYAALLCCSFCTNLLPLSMFNRACLTCANRCGSTREGAADLQTLLGPGVLCEISQSCWRETPSEFTCFTKARDWPLKSDRAYRSCIILSPTHFATSCQTKCVRPKPPATFLLPLKFHTVGSSRAFWQIVKPDMALSVGKHNLDVLPLRLQTNASIYIKLQIFSL